MGSKMSSKRQSSNSQNHAQYGDGRWDSSNSSAVDGCENSLSTLSLVSEPYRYEPRGNYLPYLGASAGSGSGVSPSYLPGVPEYSDQYPYPYPLPQAPASWTSPTDLYQTQAAPLNESSMDSGAGYIGSTLVSPSSTPPSRRSTMDDVPRLAQHQVGVNRTPERRSSGDAPKRDKKGGNRRHRDQQSRAPKSDKGNNDITTKGKAQSLYPYPPVLDDADLYDHPPASLSNGSWTQRDGYEDWDMCEIGI